MFRSVSDHRDRNGVVLDTIHIERSWQSREDHRDRGLLLPQPISAEDFPFPWYVTAFPLHFMDLLWNLVLSALALNLQLNCENYLEVFCSSQKKEFVPTHGKCTSVKTPCILGYNQWRKAFETLYFILGTVHLLMTFFCTTQMEKVKKKKKKFSEATQ